MHQRDSKLRARVLSVLAAIAILVSTGTSQVAAYNDFDNVPCRWVNWWWGVNVDYRFDASFPSSSIWRGPFDEAVQAWNNAPVKPNLNHYSGSWNGVYLYSNPYSVYGVTFVTCSGSTINYFSIHYNTAFATVNYYGRRHITAHELGHGLALGHSYDWAIMITNEPVNLSPIDPQWDDVNGLNSMYP